MDGQVIINAISTVGFPIVMCLILLYVVEKQNEEHKEEMAKITESLNNNTLVIQHLTDTITSVSGLGSTNK